MYGPLEFEEGIKRSTVLVEFFSFSILDQMKAINILPEPIAHSLRGFHVGF